MHPPPFLLIFVAPLPVISDQFPNSRRALFRVFDSGFVQIEDISGIILVKEFFKKSN